MSNEFDVFRNLQETLKSIKFSEGHYGQINSALKGIVDRLSPVNGLALDANRSAIASLIASLKIRQDDYYRNMGMALDSVQGLKRDSFALSAIEQSQIDFDRFSAQIGKQSEVWQRLCNPTNTLVDQLRMNNITAASIAWSSSISQINHCLEEIDLSIIGGISKINLASRLLEPSRMYTKFAEKTHRRIEKSESKKVSNALELSLELAEEQLLITTDALTEIIATPEDNEIASPPRRLLLPFVQQDELIAIVESESEYDEMSLIDRSLNIKTANDARYILQLINQCNEIRLGVGETAIFKPTVRILEAFADFPWLAVRNKRDLADVVDCLYFMFYEGAGKDKLRFLRSHGGVLDNDNCTVIWHIKTLRNKWLRHDVNHGNETEIKKSWDTLSQSLKELGFNHVPTNSQQFSYLHQRLLKEAVVFLKLLSEKLI